MRYRDPLLGITPIAKVTSPVYPNPAKNKITLEINKFSDDLHYMIFNAMGEIVLEENEFTSNKQEISIKKLNQGVYFIKVFKENKVIKTLKFVVN